MNSIYYILFFLSITPCLFGQDTLIQTNSNVYGFSQTYVMYPNGQFAFESTCNCTGSKSCGSGYYTLNNHNISFQFDSTLSANQSPYCRITIIQATHIVKQKKDQLKQQDFYFINVENPDKPWKSKRKKVKHIYTYIKKN